MTTIKAVIILLSVMFVSFAIYDIGEAIDYLILLFK